MINKELDQEEKNECKIIISEYLNNSMKSKKIEAKNANQLFYIIDYLIEFINKKERVYKEKIGCLAQDYGKLVKTIIENKSEVDNLKTMFQHDKEVIEKLKNLKFEIDDEVGSNKNYIITKMPKVDKEENYVSNSKRSEENNFRDKRVEDNIYQADKFCENKEINSKQIIYKKSFPTNKKI